MTVTSGFYNSLNGDRKYDALQMSSLFDGIIRDGVFSTIGTALAVQASGTGMGVLVGIGRAWFNHTWTNNDAILPMTIAQSELTLNRIDVIYLEVNNSDDVRSNSIKMLKGTPATTPAAPALTNTERIKQYPLAHILVKAGVTKITQADITSKIGTTDCPYATGVLQQVTIDSILSQWQSQYDQWFAATDASFDTWFANTDRDYDIWYNNFTNEVVAWYAASQDGFETWLQHMKDLFQENPVGNIQNQVDLLKQATGVAYNNTSSKLKATNVQQALDEINSKTGSTGVFIQGKTIVFGDTSITETFTADGSTLVTTFNNDGTITEAYTSSGVTKTKKITFNIDGTISEVII